MAKKHKAVDQFIEASMCHSHIAALLAEMLQRKKFLNYGSQNFHLISQNIPIDESK